MAAHGSVVRSVVRALGEWGLCYSVECLGASVRVHFDGDLDFCDYYGVVCDYIWRAAVLACCWVEMFGDLDVS